MEKNLAQLLTAIKPVKIIGPTDKTITGVESDSRKVAEGSLFIAVPGVTTDGHKFIPEVIAAGASAVVCEKLPETLSENVTYIQVEHSASALGFLASEWFGNPSKTLKVVGVTGTNGKTTTATLLYELTRMMGYRTGLISTVCNYIDSQPVPTTQTTPDQITINRLMRDMVEAGCKYAFMEVSSHAADQCRIDGLHFTGAIFTNLTRDHLDYHKTVDAYLKAKKRFFDILPADAFALVNADDKAGTVMLQNTAASKHTYSLRTDADFRCKIIESRLDGTLLEIDKHQVETMFTGRFNAYNLLAVYGAARLLGLDEEETLVDMSRLVPVAGRFQTFHSPKGYTAVVDYAHTPDALVNVLNSIREVIGHNGKIITVVGAGGNRDRGKRPIMAKEACRLSDKLILTSDNPRFEDPNEILQDMVAGLDTQQRANTLRIADRREAIRTAAQFAQNGDVVLVAGKGHENYQEICGVKHHFDDREVVQDIFKEEQRVIKR